MSFPESFKFDRTTFWGKNNLLNTADMSKMLFDFFFYKIKF
jgi:hypothetical protein